MKNLITIFLISLAFMSNGQKQDSIWIEKVNGDSVKVSLENTYSDGIQHYSYKQTRFNKGALEADSVWSSLHIADSLYSGGVSELLRVIISPECNLEFSDNYHFSKINADKIFIDGIPAREFYNKESMNLDSMAQLSVINIYDKDDFPKHENIDGYEWIPQYGWNKKTDYITINDFLEYKQECFNDSIYVEYLKYNSPPSYTDPKTGATMTLSIHMAPILIKEWQHKNPNDFGDFLNWLKERKGK